MIAGEAVPAWGADPPGGVEAGDLTSTIPCGAIASGIPTNDAATEVLGEVARLHLGPALCDGGLQQLRGSAHGGGLPAAGRVGGALLAQLQRQEISRHDRLLLALLAHKPAVR